MKCYNCNGLGHMARDCPSEQVERKNTGGRNFEGRRNNDTKCYNCQKFGHMARDCTKEQAPKECFSCHKQGHISRDCPEGGDKKVNI